MMTISIDAVAAYSSADIRTIQRATRKVHAIGLIEQSAGTNSKSEWFFGLQKVLPLESVAWFRELVEVGHVSESVKQNSGVAFGSVAPAFGSVAPAFGGGGVSDLTSYSFVLNKARLADLAGFCEGIGIAVTGTQWRTLQVHHAALEVPRAVDCLYLLAADSGVIEADAVNRSRVFITAVVAKTKNHPWGYFRSLLMTRMHLTTYAKKTELTAAANMLRIADGDVPSLHEPNATEIENIDLDPGAILEKILRAFKRHSWQYERPALTKLLGPDLDAIVTEVGAKKIADVNRYTIHAVRQAVADVLRERSKSI